MKKFRGAQILIILLLSYGFAILGCRESKNSVLSYLKNAELQYEGKTQEQNILTALNDIINLSEERLKSKRYKDYTGKENQWDLPTLMYKHFVPDSKGKSLGNKFYQEVKSKEVQEKIKEILEKIPIKQLQTPTEYLKKVVTKLESVDFYPEYPESTDDIFYSIDVQDHWLYDELNKAFAGVKKIWHISVKKKAPLIEESKKYYPSLSIEEWHFNSKLEAEKSVMELNRFMNSHHDDELTELFKGKVLAGDVWWEDNERIYFIHIRSLDIS